MRGLRLTGGLLLSAALAASLPEFDALSPCPAHADERTEKLPEPGEIKHEAVSDVLPRDRNELGIGERAFFWIERPKPKDAAEHPRARREAAAGAGLADYMIWTVTDNSTFLPTVTRVGDRTILAVGLSDRAGQFSVGAEYLRPGDAEDRLREWQPVVPAPGAAQRDPPGADQKPVAPGAEDAAWEKKLYRLCDLRKARETPFDDVERLAREILSEPRTDKDQALVYFHLAELYAQSGMVHPERVLEYSRRALALPVDPIQRTILYIYRGDASLARRGEATFYERRRAAAVEYLQGLAEIARHDLPAESRERQFMRIYHGDDGDEGAKQMQKVHEFNARVDFETTLLQYRQLLRQQLKSLFFPR